MYIYFLASESFVQYLKNGGSRKLLLNNNESINKKYIEGKYHLFFLVGN